MASGTANRYPELRGSETVLVVEDDAHVLQVMLAFLDHYGYVVLTACDGMEALSLAEGHGGPIHLLVTDIVLPRVRGPDLAAALSVRFPSVRTLYISGYPEGEQPNCKLPPGAHFLQKPFSGRDLLQRARQILDGDGPTPTPGQQPPPR